MFTREELLRGVWGFQLAGRDAHAGLARLAAAEEAERRRRRVRGQRLGRRLPADRRGEWSGELRWRRPRARVAAAGVARGAVAGRARAVEGGWRRWRGRATSCAGRSPPPRLGLELGWRGRARCRRRSCGRSTRARQGGAGARRPRRARRRRADGADRASSPARSISAAARRLGAGVATRRRASRRRAAACDAGDGRPPAVRGDRLRLAQATGNLIANAIEHGGGTGRGARGSAAARRVADRGHRRRAGPAGAGGRARRGARGVAAGAHGRGLAIAAAIAAVTAAASRLAPARRGGARLVLELPAVAPQPTVAGRQRAGRHAPASLGVATASPTHTRPDGTASARLRRRAAPARGRVHADRARWTNVSGQRRLASRRLIIARDAGPFRLPWTPAVGRLGGASEWELGCIVGDSGLLWGIDSEPGWQGSSHPATRVSEFGQRHENP